MTKIALIIPGGYGNKDERRNIPALSALIHRLSVDFKITVYSLSRIDQAEDVIIKFRSVNAEHHSNLVVRLVKFVWLFLKDHLSERFQIIHGIWAVPAGFIAVILSRLLNLRSVVSLMGGEAACVQHISYGNMIHQPLKKLTLFTCQHAHELLALTNYQINNLMSFGLRRDNPRIIPYGVDPHLFKFKNKDLGIPVNFLHIANLTEVKDQQTLLRAVALVKESVNCRLRIIGEDFLDGKIQKLALKLSISDMVEFLGYVPHNVLPRHYEWAHMLLHTSYYEGQAVVLAEAAMSGVVICGTDVGLISDLGPECVITCAPGAHEDLAKKIIELIGNPNTYIRLQSRALKWAVSHDIEWTAEMYSNLYKSMM